MKKKMYWNEDTEWDVFPDEPIGKITNDSFFLKQKKIVVFYQGCDKYPASFEENISELDDIEFSPDEGKRGFEIDLNVWHEDLIEKLKIYLTLVSSLSVKLLHLNGAEELYLTLKKDDTDSADDYTEITNLYEYFLKHINLKIKDLVCPLIEHLMEEDRRREEENKRYRHQNELDELSMGGLDRTIQAGESNSFYNDDIDLDQQSQEFWDNV